MSKKNGSITLTRRQAVLRRDQFRCQLCGRGADDGVRLEVDHRTPLSRGGQNEDANLWTLCDACNRGKSGRWDDGAHSGKLGMAFRPGHIVACKTEVEERRCIGEYVIGEIQAVDATGARITLPDFLSGTFTNWDVVIPWDELRTAMICTEDHDAELFVNMLRRRSGVPTIGRC